MTELFGRSADIVVGDQQITGLDVAFDVQKSVEPEPNTCELTIWNLSEGQRAQLEELEPKPEDARGIPVKIEAGYGGDNAQLWLGDLRSVDSIREGPDWVTRLDSGDGEKAAKGKRIAVPYGPNTPVDTALRAMVRALGVGEGNVGTAVAKLKQAGAAKLFPNGKVLHGPVARRLTEFARSADLEWSIQDGALQITDRGKVLAGQAVKLSAGSGMIGSPTVDQDGILTVQCLMIPDLRVAGLIVVDSARIKGSYRVERARWTGDTRGGPWYVTLNAKRF